MTATPRQHQATTRHHDLYRELVLAHASAPHNFGRCADPTHQADGINSLCGDKLTLFLDVGPDGVVERATFEGVGCAISLASASMLTDSIAGHTVDDARRLASQVVAALAGEGPADELADESLQALCGVRRYPSRIKCATLAWQTLNTATDPAAASRITSTE